MYNGKYLRNIVEYGAKSEDNSCPSPSVTLAFWKGYVKMLTVAGLAAIVFGLLAFFLIQATILGVFFFAPGVLMMLVLPSYLSYQCYVDNFVLKESYRVLFIQRKKSTRWEEVKYKMIKRNEHGDIISIKLYNAKKKKLFKFDSTMIGFEALKRRVKRKNISPLKPKHR